MFTGIIESLGSITSIVPQDGNVHFEITCSIVKELKVDQSVAHNGVCLTVTKIDPEKGTYWVTAIQETLNKTNLANWKEGKLVNLERCMLNNGRFDGHIVQGHVDLCATCTHREETDGSWRFSFEYDPKAGQVMVEKGSITINGISLTCFDVKNNGFSVAIIPYTYEHTDMHTLTVGDTINLEFDIIGKYVQRLLHQGKE